MPITHYEAAVPEVAGGLGELSWVGLAAGVLSMRYGEITEPTLRNTGNTYTAKHRMHIGIDRTARTQPCLQGSF